MAIAQTIKTAARAARVLGKKKKKQAIKASKSALKRGAELTSKGSSKLKKAASVAAGTKTAQVAADKAKNIADKTKKVARSTGVKVRRKIGLKGREAVKKTGETITKAASIVGEKAGSAALGIGGAGALGGGVVGGVAGLRGGQVVRGGLDKLKKMKGKPVRDAAQKNLDEMNDMMKGGVIGGGIGAVSALAATGALTASLIKSSTPKESEFNITRLRDGRYSTQFKDKNANAVFSAKQLSPKEIDDVRTQLAILDSIVLSDDPKSRSKQFVQIATYLADEYKISNITGNNLSLIIPNVEGGVQTRRKF
jgi:hypothetical protein